MIALRRLITSAGICPISQAMYMTRSGYSWCLQGLLLRANGYQCEQGIIYYVGSKRRVSVGFDDRLVKQTLALLEAARAMATDGEIPPPLEDSPKCPRCSLVGICLPDEVSFLKGNRYLVRPDDVRRLMPARDDALPMYVVGQGSVVGKSGETLTVRVKGKTAAKARLLDISSLSIFGNVQVTAQATRELLERGIPICHFTYGGWLKGMTWGMAHKNVELRMHQFRVAGDTPATLAIAKEVVTAKLRNSRVMLRRNHPHASTAALEEMKRLTARGGGGRLLCDTAWHRRGCCARLFCQLRRHAEIRDFRV